MISTVLACHECRSALAPASDGGSTCRCGGTRFTRTDGIFCRADLQLSSEAEVRDRQAAGYLEHAKFPTQVARLKEWIAGVPPQLARYPALDLGSGSGPTTALLLAAGFRVVAIDFSIESLWINRKQNLASAANAAFVCDDLTRTALTPRSVGVVVASDVLQHIENRRARELLLAEIQRALVPGGRLFLSFFNLNLKHYLKGRSYGTFAGGAIKYERLLPQDVTGSLPDFIVVDRMYPTNIFHAAWLDRIAAAVPFARVFARMINVHARRVER